MLSVVNLFVFLLIMTALVHATQLGRNPVINNYADALYFTVTTLTTTGFGDITLQGTSGRLLAVLIMIFGVSLFIRLVQTLFRPQKVHYSCRSAASRATIPMRCTASIAARRSTSRPRVQRERR